MSFIQKICVSFHNDYHYCDKNNAYVYLKDLDTQTVINLSKIVSTSVMFVGYRMYNSGRGYNSLELIVTENQLFTSNYDVNDCILSFNINLDSDIPKSIINIEITAEEEILIN